MQIFFLPDYLTVIIIFIVWPTIQVGSALICLYLPDKVFNYQKGIFKTRKFENNGKIYQTLFRVKKWKHLLPDGGAVAKKRGYRKKKLTSYKEENLKKFLIESCRAELSHLLPILLFWVFFLFTTPFTTLLMFIYSLIVNLPCLIVQRYNRPRIINILKN